MISHQSIVREKLLEWAKEKNIPANTVLDNSQLLWSIAQYSAPNNKSTALLVSLMIGETCGHFPRGTMKDVFKRKEQ